MDMMYGQSMLYANLKGFFLQESKIFFFQGHVSYTRKKMKLQYVCGRVQKRRGYKNSKRENSIFVDDLNDS